MGGHKNGGSGVAFEINPHTAARIKELIALHPQRPDSWIAARAEVSCIHVRRVRRGELHLSDEAEIHFREVRPYTCPTCERRICLRPCPACVAADHRARRK